ncbi:hypothetical protein BRADI_1g78151v3 [Brachypodium distachyon]|uniref:Protein PAIR1 n=1 Tax=Brachypodium distachyon TaxID=15368 RepID=A0A2K2DVR0_BRADI|nr:hypothetical protein BRADI_1g78151v3 [Brachypodium distachyon]
MKLKINKACDLGSISVLPPRRTGGSGGGGGGGGGMAASASAAASQQQQRSQTMSQQSFSQSVGASFSQGGGASFSQGGGASFSQGVGGGSASFSQRGGGASFSQGGGASFSQGVGGGSAPFSQGGSGGGGGGGGGASFSQGGGGSGGASFSQAGGGAALLHSQSQLSQASLDENLLSLHHPSPARDQRFGLHDDSSKRMPSFPANSASCVRDESQLQLAKVPSNSIHRWNPSLPDSRCQVSNEDVERKFQHLASSVHKMGMVLDSVQNDVMQTNRAMKEALLDSGSIQKKIGLLENSVQQILKGQDGLKALLEGCSKREDDLKALVEGITKGQDDLRALLEGSTKSNSDELSVLNSHTSKLNEISTVLSILPKQVQADLSQLKGDIFRIFTKEMEGIVRAIRSLNGRPVMMQTLASCTVNGKPEMNQTPVANGSPPMNQRPVADGRPQMKQTPVANGRPHVNQTPVANGSPLMNQRPVANGRRQMKQTPVANGRPQMNQIPEANGRLVVNQIPVTKVLPAPLVNQRKVGQLKPKVEQGKVKAFAQKLVGPGYCRLAPKQEEAPIQKINLQVPIKKAPVSITIDSDDDSASCIILNTGTGANVGELPREEATSEEALQILRRARKRRRREMHSIVLI